MPAGDKPTPKPETVERERKVQRGAGQLSLPREHGATAMLLAPFFAAAILLRRLYWPELVALVAAACALAIKDPLVVMARQRFIWKQEHAETKAARRSVVMESSLLAACGLVLVMVRDWRPLLVLFFAAGAFTILAVTLNVRNRQRSEWFQVASAFALTASSLMACLAAVGAIRSWCWLLWILCALQAAAGIFVVHARLDARIAARKGHNPPPENRRAALVSQVVLIAAAVYFAFAHRPWITAALTLAAIAYLADLKRQRSASSLQMPLKSVGLQALGLSIAYALLLVAGFWSS